MILSQFLFQFLVIIHFANSVLKECFGKDGVKPVNDWESPCLCKNIKCFKGWYCNEQEMGCTLLGTSIQSQVKIEGHFSFKSAFANDEYHNSLMNMNERFETLGQLTFASWTVSDVGNGTFWVKQNVMHSWGQPNRVQDVVVMLRNWSDDSILKYGYFRTIDIHELRRGHHSLEVICITFSKLALDYKAKQGNDILIIDFTQDQPKTETIEVHKDFNPDLDWGKLSTNLDWMHANSVGVDNDGNYYLNGRHGSFLTLQERNSKEKMQTISSEFRSDYRFANASDKFQNAHDVHQLENGNWLLQDNGNKRPKQEGGEQSRCIEYEFNHQDMIVTKVWEYRLEYRCIFCGSCRQMSNGNILINFANCLPVGLRDKPEAWDQIEIKNYHNQIQEVARSGLVVGIASIPWDRRQIIQRIVPLNDVLKWQLRFGSIIFIVPITILFIALQYCYKYGFISRKNEIEIKQTNLEQNDLEQNRLEQNRLEQNRLEQNRLEQKDFEQNDFEQNDFEQNRLGQIDLEQFGKE